MSRSIHPIEHYMTLCPHTIGDDQTLASASELMHIYRIRHLPVLHGGQLVGILSDRDVKLIETFRDVNPEEVLVEEAMSTAPYATSIKTPLDEVVQTMAEHKYGSCVVMHNHKVVGIFTTVDACRVLADVLKKFKD